MGSLSSKKLSPRHSTPRSALTLPAGTLNKSGLDTLKSNVITTLTNYNSSTLQKFDGVFRYSKVVGLIDDTDTSIVSYISTIKIRKSFTPTLNSSTRYDVYFRNALYNPHSGHKAEQGGILVSSGFKLPDDTNVYYLDEIISIIS